MHIFVWVITGFRMSQINSALMAVVEHKVLLCVGGCIGAVPLLCALQMNLQLCPLPFKVHRNRILRRNTLGTDHMGLVCARQMGLSMSVMS